MLKSIVKVELEKMCKTLEQARSLRMFDPKTWVDDNIPSGAGVYVIWDVSEKKPIYVGESSSLKSRMKNLERSEKHTFRRKVGDKLNVASDALSKEMSERYVVSFIEVSFGRAELEEYLIKRWGTVMNKSAKKPDERYKWVETDKPPFPELKC